MIDIMKKRAAKKNSSHAKPARRWQPAPLKGSFMATSILGFLISAYWVYPQSQRYAIAFMIVFAAMFIASIISMGKAPVISEKY